MCQELVLKEIVERIFRLLPSIPQHHKPDSELYLVLDKIIQTYFSGYKKDTLEIFPFDGMIWPKVSMGNLTSYNWFILHEMVVYSFYWVNKDIYRTAFDIGACSGIDSIILSRFGYEVYAFEPDPMLYEMLLKNIQLNQCRNIHTFQKAVSNRPGVDDFVRIKGNLTSSCILGAKDFYGDTESLKVETFTFQDIGLYPDLMKINVEGSENKIVSSIGYPVWEKMDVFIEVHNQENTESIFNYFSGTNINIFARKIGWQKVKRMEEMPTDYRQGHIFVSKKQEMPWFRKGV